MSSSSTVTVFPSPVTTVKKQISVQHLLETWLQTPQWTLFFFFFFYWCPEDKQKPLAAKEDTSRHFSRWKRAKEPKSLISWWRSKTNRKEERMLEIQTLLNNQVLLGVLQGCGFCVFSCWRLMLSLKMTWRCSHFGRLAASRTSVGRGVSKFSARSPLSLGKLRGFQSLETGKWRPASIKQRGEVVIFVHSALIDLSKLFVWLLSLAVF